MGFFMGAGFLFHLLVALVVLVVLKWSAKY